MKPKTHMTKHIILTFAGSLLLNASASAALLVSGSATIDYNKTAWDGLASGFGAGPNVLTLDRYFTQADANALTSAQLLSDPAQPSPSYTGQVYAMNGTSVSNLTGRYTQATDFDFTLGTPQAHTGEIGLGGVSRFTVSPLIGGGSLVYGDFTLQYSATRIGLGGSGWYLKNNILPAGASFDILNPNIVETPTTLSISGDLGVSYEVANFLYFTPSDAGVDVGDFSFVGNIAPVPEPATACFGLVAVAASLVRNRRSRRTA